MMSGKKHNVNDFLLDDHFLRWVKAPDDELQSYWIEFIRLHPDAEEDMQEARKMILQLNFQEKERPLATQSRIKAQIDFALAADRSTEEEVKPEGGLKFWVKVAASISGIIVLLSAYLLFDKNEISVYRTAYGETQVITLPDQSIVTLNANSSLNLIEDQWQDATDRQVWLQGEAFFEVEERINAKGEPAKFLVHSSNVEVEVLGTSFNVNSRNSQTKVVLNSGKVKLSIFKELEDVTEQVYMKPGEMIAIDEIAVSFERKMVDPNQFISWKENRLVFEDTPLGEIIALLENNYGFKVKLSNKELLSKSFTGVAPADRVEILLDKLSLIYQINIIRDEEKLHFEPY